MLRNYPNSPKVNDISEDVQKYLAERLKVFKQKKTVAYKLLGGREERQQDGTIKIVYPSVVTINKKSRIVDPKNGAVEIGLIQSWTKEGQPNWGSAGTGKLGIVTNRYTSEFMLNAENPDDLELFPVLELHSQNAANPYRDKREEPTFKTINPEADAAKREAMDNDLFESMTAIRSWTESQAKGFGAFWNLSSELSEKTIKAELTAIAKKDPEAFFKAINSPKSMVKALVNVSVQRGVIAFDPVNYTVKDADTQEILLRMDRKEGVDWKDDFVQFLESAKNGASVKKMIENKLKAK